MDTRRTLTRRGERQPSEDDARAKRVPLDSWTRLANYLATTRISSRPPLSGTTLVPTIREESISFSSRSLSSYDAVSPFPATRALDVSDFKALRLIGKGAYGSVYLVINTGTHRQFALKVVQKTKLSLNNFGDIFEEQRIGRSLHDSRWLLSLEGSFHDKDYFYLLTKYCPGGSLDQRIRHCLFPKRYTRKVLAELILAVEELHERRIIHGDIKLENVLMDEHGHVVLADFGQAKAFGVADTDRPWKRMKTWKKDSAEGDTPEIAQDAHPLDATYALRGTHGYIAPEVYTGVASYEADVWSLGVVFHMLYYGEFPFNMEPMCHTASELLELTLYGELEKHLLDFCPRAFDLMGRMLERDRSRRITLAEMKQHPYFETIDWEHVADRPPSLNPSSFSENDDPEPEGITIPSGDSYQPGRVPFSWFQYASSELQLQCTVPSESASSEDLASPVKPAELEEDATCAGKRNQLRLEAIGRMNRWLKHRTMNKLRALPPGERMLLD